MTSRRCTTTPADLDSPPIVSCTITLEEEELRQLLNERDHLRKQVTELQVRNTELIEAERDLTRLRYQLDLSGKLGTNHVVHVLPSVKHDPECQARIDTDPLGITHCCCGAQK